MRTTHHRATPRFSPRNRRLVREALSRAGLPEKEVAALARISRLEQVPQGAHLASLGGYGTHVALVLSGKVSVERTGGRVSALAPTADSPAVIGELSALGYFMYQIATVTVTEPATVLFIPAAAFRRAVDELPIFAAYVDEHRRPRHAETIAFRAADVATRAEAYRTYLAALDRVQGKRLPA